MNLQEKLLKDLPIVQSHKARDPLVLRAPKPPLPVPIRSPLKPPVRNRRVPDPPISGSDVMVSVLRSLVDEFYLSGFRLTLFGPLRVNVSCRRALTNVTLGIDFEGRRISFTRKIAYPFSESDIRQGVAEEFSDRKDVILSVEPYISDVDLGCSSDLDNPHQ